MACQWWKQHWPCWGNTTLNDAPYIIICSVWRKIYRFYKPKDWIDPTKNKKKVALRTALVTEWNWFLTIMQVPGLYITEEYMVQWEKYFALCSKSFFLSLQKGELYTLKVHIINRSSPVVVYWPTQRAFCFITDGTQWSFVGQTTFYR